MFFLTRIMNREGEALPSFFSLASKLLMARDDEPRGRTREERKVT